MKLATLKNDSRDGALVVVNRDLSLCQRAPGIADTLQQALDDWSECEPRLRQIYDSLNDRSSTRALPFDSGACHAPLPRAFQWADGSAYLNHVELVRKARGAERRANW